MIHPLTLAIRPTIRAVPTILEEDLDEEYL